MSLRTALLSAPYAALCADAPAWAAALHDAATNDYSVDMVRHVARRKGLSGAMLAKVSAAYEYVLMTGAKEVAK